MLDGNDEVIFGSLILDALLVTFLIEEMREQEMFLDKLLSNETEILLGENNSLSRE
jgi:hypothetical protein